MQRRVWLIGMSVVLGLYGSATAEPATDDLAKLKQSEAKWQKLRDSLSGTYTYKVAQVFFIGRQETTIQVRDNKAAERSLVVMGPPAPVLPGKPPAAVEPKWVETGKELDTHREGAPARTIDELYVEAAKILQLPLEPHHKRYFMLNDQGLLNYCFVVDTRIADDAPRQGVGPIQLLVPKE